MDGFVTFTVLGIVFGSIYAIASSGLVITYATSNVFNVAHGAVAMVMSFVYWEFAINRGLPVWLAVPITLLIAAVVGALLERTIMRRLTDATVVRSLTVTVGLLVLGIGVAQTIWPPAGRVVPPFFEGRSVQIGNVFVTWHQIIVFLTALAVAGLIFLLLNRTRIGIGMRAIVDNRTLLALHGANPDQLSMLSWALGSMLAALAGILLVSDVGLDYIPLTFLVVSAYAAAVVGRLTSLPMTFIGAMGLGIAQNYYTWLSPSVLGNLEGSIQTVLAGVRAALPTLLLFAMLLIIPQEKLRVGAVSGATLTKLPTRRRVAVSGVALVVATMVVTSIISTADVFSVGQALAYACIMLSLVLLTGYGGDVSLGHMTFAGVGALVVARGLPFAEQIPLIPDGGTLSLRSLALAGLSAGVVGLVIGIPALRLRGLYLGLATLAFAQAMDRMFFASDYGFKLGGSLVVERPSFPLVDIGSERAYAVFLAVVFVLLSFLVLEFRRSRFGRLLLATRDSPAACGTLGLSITRTRVGVFAGSAALAGVGGGLFAGTTQAAAATDYGLLEASLPLLLLAVVGGITSVTGALIGGLLLGLGSLIAETFGGSGSSIFLGTGLAALAIAYFPQGLSAGLFSIPKRLGLVGDDVASTITDEELEALVEESREVSPVAVA